MQVDRDLRSAYLDIDRHPDALRQLAVRSLRRNAPAEAFAFADRLCRLTRYADPSALVLRGEALEARGDRDGFEADVVAAFAIDPTLPSAARLRLTFAHGEESLEIARLILQSPHADRAATLAAVEAIFSAGYGVIVDLRLGNGAAGAVAWQAPTPLELDWPGRSGWLTIAPDRRHRLADARWSAAALTLADSEGVRAVLHELRARGVGDTLGCFAVWPRQDTPTEPSPLPKRNARISVIVPLFGDRRMTQLCLVTLGRQKHEMPGLRVVLVNDNPGDAAIAATARDLSSTCGFELVTNPANLGFARSVNRALEAMPTGDVVLLNADVLLPPGAIARLASVAASAPDIGTVTPLSNNGEEMSFPSPFHPGRLEPFRRVCEIDRIAARENAARVVSLVNGVGFCLLVTRRALDALGPLPEAYERGYYEDVDYCLRARRAGLRNVCATNVYVGHKGSSSFRGSKRALVVRNQRVLERRFPGYVDESAAFVAADPLKAARAAIETRIAQPRAIDTVVIVPPEAAARVSSFVQALGARRSLCLTWSPDTPAVLALRMSDGSCPQSLEFGRADEDRSLIDCLHRIGVKTACLVGPVIDKTNLTARLFAAGFAIEILFDDSFLRVATSGAGLDCPATAGPHPCEACIEAFSHTPVAARRGTAPGLGGVLRMAGRVRPMNAMARAVADHFSLPAHGTDAPAPSLHESATPRTTTRLGVLVPSEDVVVQRLLQALAMEASDRAEASIIVLGRSLDAECLMSWPRVFVTGDATEDELGMLLDRYAVDVVLAPDRWSGFGALERRAGGRPKAYFDWSGGLLPKDTRDLALDPRLCDRKVAYRVDQWWRGLKIAE